MSIKLMKNTSASKQKWEGGGGLTFIIIFNLQSSEIIENKAIEKLIKRKYIDKVL